MTRLGTDQHRGAAAEKECCVTVCDACCERNVRRLER